MDPVGLDVDEVVDGVDGAGEQTEDAVAASARPVTVRFSAGTRRRRDEDVLVEEHRREHEEVLHPLVRAKRLDQALDACPHATSRRVRDGGAGRRPSTAMPRRRTRSALERSSWQLRGPTRASAPIAQPPPCAQRGAGRSPPRLTARGPPHDSQPPRSRCLPSALTGADRELVPSVAFAAPRRARRVRAGGRARADDDGARRASARLARSARRRGRPRAGPLAYVALRSSGRSGIRATRPRSRRRSASRDRRAREPAPLRAYAGAARGLRAAPTRAISTAPRARIAHLGFVGRWMVVGSVRQRGQGGALDARSAPRRSTTRRSTSRATTTARSSPVRWRLTPAFAVRLGRLRRVRPPGGEGVRVRDDVRARSRDAEGAPSRADLGVGRRRRARCASSGTAPRS